VSITRSSTTATVTQADHGIEVGERIKIIGATQTEYNGIVTVTAVTTNTWSYTVSGSPATPATGSPEMYRYDHRLKYIGDTFNDCSQFHVGGLLEVEFNGCTFQNGKAGSAAIAIIVGNSNVSILPKIRIH